MSTDPNRKIWPPNDTKLIAAVKQAIAWEPNHRTVPIFDFAITPEAAEHNLAILEAADFDLQLLLLKDGFSPLQPGSEFRPVGLLAPIFENHPFWSNMRSTCLLGASFESVPLPEQDQLTLLDEALQYGNHKSATLNGPMLMKMLDKEAEKGWHIPLPIYSLRRIPGVIVAPMGLVHQTSIDENNKATAKWRLTHDQSFQFGLDKIKSVNQRIPKSSLTACNYGFTLRRVVHMIVSLRGKFPDAPLLMGKLDFKSAYRRMHLHGTSSLQCVVTTTGLDPDQPPIALVALRATFGGKPCPFRWSKLSEPIADLANALARCELWDPSAVRPLHHELIGNPKYADREQPLEQARKLRVDTEADEFGMTDVFLDDLITVFPALNEDHINRGALAALLALDVVSRPLVTNGETLPRDHMLAIDKAMAEGTPSEIQIILGWEINTRRLTIALPTDKHVAWKQDIHEILHLASKNKRIRHSILETILGRLQHAAAILSEGSHFLNRIRTAEQRAKQARSGSSRLCVETRKDLAYWISLLDRAAKGVSLNLLVYRVPDQILRTDACEHGLGGYSLTTGRAWRWEIPVEHRLKKSINFLEFLACITGIILSLHDGEGAEEDCILSLGDNTSSLGWLRKSNFAADEEQASHSALARHFALIMAGASRCHFSQWFAGKENEVADLLSRDHDKSDDSLTAYNSFVFAAQVSPEFHISPLPEELTCWLAYWVQHERGTTESPPPLTGGQTGTGRTGSSTWTTATSSRMNSSNNLTEPPGIRSWEATLNESERRPIPARVHRKMLSWLQRHALAPSEAYVRPCSAMKERPIHRWIQMEKLHLFYRGSGKDTETATQPCDRRKRSLSIS